jgi:hypothetical protein
VVKREWIEWHYKEDLRDLEADNKVGDAFPSSAALPSEKDSCFC